MTPLDRAVAICGTQAELVRRVKGKPATGYVYYWRNNGVSEADAIAIERAVAGIVAESAEAASRAKKHGGCVTVEEILPGVQWMRDEDGAVTGWVTLAPPEVVAEQPGQAA